MSFPARSAVKKSESYGGILAVKEVPYELEIKLSQAIKENDVDRFAIILGLSKLTNTYHGDYIFKFRISFFYDEDSKRLETEDILFAINSENKEHAKYFLVYNGYRKIGGIKGCIYTMEEIVYKMKEKARNSKIIESEKNEKEFINSYIYNERNKYLSYLNKNIDFIETINSFEAKRNQYLDKIIENLSNDMKLFDNVIKNDFKETFSIDFISSGNSLRSSHPSHRPLSAIGYVRRK